MELCTYDFGTICDFIQKEAEIEKNYSHRKTHPTH